MDIPDKPQLYVLVGVSETGKSFATKSIIYHLAKNKKISRAVCITNTKCNGGYDFLPDRCVWDGYDEEQLQAYVDKLKKKRAEGTLKPSALIFDDMLGSLPLDSKLMTHLITCYPRGLIPINHRKLEPMV